MKILISAGEASGDRYAAQLVEALRARMQGVEFFGCAGPRLRAAGVRPVVEAERLAVVGLVEVLAHLPEIWRAYRRLSAAARAERPRLAILTDAPDFHLRLAKRLHRASVPVVYLVAPQAWAWRRGRVRQLRRLVAHLLCIFPFEEPFFRRYGVTATYIGHPLAGRVAPRFSREEFFRKHRLAPERPLVAVLPGSRRGESARHLPPVLEAVRELNQWRALHFVLAASETTGGDFFAPRLGGSEVRVVEGETWDVLAHAEAALVASGTATVEAALLQTPMVAFYKVHPASWLLGRRLVRAPHLSMVNLLAGERLVPELIQGDCTGPKLAAALRELLERPERLAAMRARLGELKRRLETGTGAVERAAAVVEQLARSLEC